MMPTPLSFGPSQVRLVLLLTLLALGAQSVLYAQARRTRERARTPEVAERVADLAERAAWRALGPATFSGRIVDLAVDPRNSATFYIAAGSGGLWKTTNRGTTFQRVSDDWPSQSIGDIALAPSLPDRIYVGLGEANNQRSSYWGNGVWRSDDAGKSWQHLGLPDSGHIGRIVVHPDDPDHFYVAVLGHLYSANPERGLYRSRDGGKSFQLIKAIDADTGFVDVAMDPGNPDHLLAASYERRRRAWNFQEGGEGSALWRSEDGGDSWKKLSEGLPGGQLGRIGLDFHRADPRVVYAVIENDNPAPPKTPDAEAGAGDTAGDEEQAFPDPGEHTLGLPPEGEPSPGAPGSVPAIGAQVYRSDDGGASWSLTNEKGVGVSPPYYFGQIRVHPADADRIWVLGVRMFISSDGGKTFSNKGAPDVHVDHHALWIDPDHPEHILLGNDGGLARSHDGGKTWQSFENLPLAQFYAVSVDDQRPYRIFGGLQDNGTWMTPSVGVASAGIDERETLRIGGGDGFYSAVDPEYPHIIYSEYQFGVPNRLDLRTGVRTGIKPRPGRGEDPLRCNWMSPLLLSPHDPRTVLFGAQRLWRSTDRGDSWEAISPDLTTADEEKMAGDVPHCTITSVSESPLRRGLIWVGTDDGKVWVTHDGGRHWRDLTPVFPDAAQGLWVSRVHASPHEEGRAFVSFTGYREDRFEPLLYVTEDFGGSFDAISRGLPDGSPVNAILEDPKRSGLLYCATEHGVQVSLNAGGSWAPLGQKLPSVACHDLALQNRVGELVVGTHGLGIYALDVHLLRHAPAARQASASKLIPPRVRSRPRGAFSRGYRSARSFRGENPRFGATLGVWVKNPPGEDDDRRLRLEVRDLDGRRLARWTLPNESGLHERLWNLRRASTRARGRTPPAVGGGLYEVRFLVGDEVRERRTFRVEESSAYQSFEALGGDEDDATEEGSREH